MDFLKHVDEIREYVTNSRHFLHSHAELSFQETETTRFLVSELKGMGIPVETFSDYTGCIAVIEGGKPGKTVLLRADIDALPIQENTGVDFASIRPGVMHACGHDCHAAMLLGAARLLWENREKLNGRVKLLFQAAEEVFVGSRYYVEHGYLDDVDAAMGMHVWPTSEAGKIAVLDGPVMASCDDFTLAVKGVSAHGSSPDQGKDAIVAASAIICGLQTAVSRENSPLRPLVVTVGKIRSGTQFNIIADTAVMEGTVRAYSQETRTMAHDSVERIARCTAEAMGCQTELDYRFLESPVRNDDLALNDTARAAAEKIFGAGGLAKASPATGSEDFCHIMDKVPSSVFVLLGCRDEACGCVYPSHNEKFMVSDSVLPAGAAYYAQFAADYLDGGKGGEDR